ncbi:RidA family protein [Phenylobacterium sp. J367]|uniref:RidA family protein n=1 Tax=Phenylobacterium sp. J367 TaxID=2898435 RepID=UPI002150C310|nr:RidA family protein [Phenylobacterium sp. J367]MCR5877065.1 RidA family protein [Phenylobacterium sp. J367]
MKLRLAALCAVLALPCAAQPAAPAYPKVAPAPGGSVIVPTAGAERAVTEFHYSPARRAGDWLYISGVIAGPAPDEKRDAEAFKAQTRRAFAHLKRTLEAGGAGFADVVMINTFHVWNGPGFTGTRDEQFAAFSAVKDEFMSEPYPAWTAVGTSGLLTDNGVVEIQMIAYAPRK